MHRFVSLFGLVLMCVLAWAISTNRRKMNWRLIFTGIGLQFIFGVIVLKTGPGRWVFDQARIAIESTIGFSDEGAKMLFGEHFKDHFFAFSVLPTVIFFSSIMSILFYVGVIQKVVNGMSWLMVRVMDVSGSESLSNAINVFVGQTEAPLVIKPYIESMTKSELHAIMLGGMANTAGGVMAAYTSFGADAGHLLACSVMSAPASLVIAKIIVPETERSKTKGVVEVDVETGDTNVLDAACRGASEGLQLALNVGAMLIAFVALAALVNAAFGLLPAVAGAPLTMERALGWVFAPIAWAIGVDGKDARAVGMLLGKKMFLNEFIAYVDLKSLKGTLSPRSFTLATYALCGFANFASIAIQIGGIGALVPKRRKDLARLGLRAMLGGTLATNMTACIAGLLI